VSVAASWSIAPSNLPNSADVKHGGKKTYSVVPAQLRSGSIYSNSQIVVSKFDYFEFDSAKTVKGISVESLLDDVDDAFLGKVANARKRLSQDLEKVSDVPSLKKLRLAAGLSQKELADAIGSKQPYVSRLEREGGNPSAARVRQLSAALSVAYNDVLEALNVKV